MRSRLDATPLTPLPSAPASVPTSPLASPHPHPTAVTLTITLTLTLTPTIILILTITLTLNLTSLTTVQESAADRRAAAEAEAAEFKFKIEEVVDVVKNTRSGMPAEQHRGGPCKVWTSPYPSPVTVRKPAREHELCSPKPRPDRSLLDEARLPVACTMSSRLLTTWNGATCRRVPSPLLPRSLAVAVAEQQAPPTPQILPPCLQNCWL